MSLFNKFKNFLNKSGKASKGAGQAAINSYTGSGYTPSYTSQSKKQQQRDNFERQFANSMSNNSYQTTGKGITVSKPKPKPKPAPKPAAKPAAKPAPKGNQSSGGGGGGYYGGGGGGGGSSVSYPNVGGGGGGGSSSPSPNSLQQEYERLRKAEEARIQRMKEEEARRRAAIKVPDKLGLQAFRPDIDALGVYNPDFDALDRSQQDILASFNEQRNVFNKQSETARQDLANRFRQLQEEQERAKRDSQRNFSTTRKSIQDDVFEAQRRDQAAASARGLSDSGAAQLGNIQRRMAEGEALSGMAQDYYDTEEGILRAMQATKENQDIAEQEVSNSLAEAMSSILNMETQQKSQYTNQMEALKRQVQEDSNALINAKNQWGQVATDQNNMVTQAEAEWARQRDQDWLSQQQADRAYQNAREQFMHQQASAQKSWEQQLADFQFRKDEAARQAALAQQAQAAQQARWQQEFGLKQKQFNSAQQRAAQAAQDESLSAYEVYDYANKNNLSEAQFRYLMEGPGAGSGATWEGNMEFGGLTDDKDKKKSKFNWDMFRPKTMVPKTPF